MLPTLAGVEPPSPGLHSDAHPTEPPRPARRAFEHAENVDSDHPAHPPSICSPFFHSDTFSQGAAQMIETVAMFRKIYARFDDY